MLYAEDFSPNGDEGGTIGACGSPDAVARDPRSDGALPGAGVAPAATAKDRRLAAWKHTICSPSSDATRTACKGDVNAGNPALTRRLQPTGRLFLRFLHRPLVPRLRSQPGDFSIPSARRALRVRARTPQCAPCRATRSPRSRCRSGWRRPPGRSAQAAGTPAAGGRKP